MYMVSQFGSMVFASTATAQLHMMWKLVHQNVEICIEGYYTRVWSADKPCVSTILPKGANRRATLCAWAKRAADWRTCCLSSVQLPYQILRLVIRPQWKVPKANVDIHAWRAGCLKGGGTPTANGRGRVTLVCPQSKEYTVSRATRGCD